MRGVIAGGFTRRIEWREQNRLKRVLKILVIHIFPNNSRYIEPYRAGGDSPLCRIGAVRYDASRAIDPPFPSVPVLLCATDHQAIRIGHDTRCPFRYRPHRWSPLGERPPLERTS